MSATCSARAAERPCDAHTSFEDIVRLLHEARSCRHANRLLNQCARRTARDVALAYIVLDRCEADFLPKASKARGDAFIRELERCAEKQATHAARERDALIAVCKANVAAKFSEK
jgi:hypothetical protein